MLTLTEFINSISSFEFFLCFASYHSWTVEDISFLDGSSLLLSSSHDKNFKELPHGATLLFFFLLISLLASKTYHRNY